MNYKIKESSKETLFEDLKIGSFFKFDRLTYFDFAYLKLSEETAMRLDNHIILDVNLDSHVIPYDHLITLTPQK